MPKVKESPGKGGKTLKRLNSPSSIPNTVKKKKINNNNNNINQNKANIAVNQDNKVRK